MTELDLTALVDAELETLGLAFRRWREVLESDPDPALEATRRFAAAALDALRSPARGIDLSALSGTDLECLRETLADQMAHPVTDDSTWAEFVRASLIAVSDEVEHRAEVLVALDPDLQGVGGIVGPGDDPVADAIAELRDGEQNGWGS